MTQFKMRGKALFDRRNHRVATTRGESIYDAENRKIGGVRGNDLFDANGGLMMQVRGRDILDERDTKVGTLLEAEQSIEGKGEENLLAALWYCFVK